MNEKKYPLYGQNNPALGWHIGIPIESEDQLPFQTVCGVKLDYTGRIYVSDTSKIKAVCPDCLRIVAEGEQAS